MYVQVCTFIRYRYIVHRNMMNHVLPSTGELAKHKRKSNDCVICGVILHEFDV